MRRLYTMKNMKRFLNDKAYNKLKTYRKEGMTIKQAFKKVTTGHIGRAK